MTNPNEEYNHDIDIEEEEQVVESKPETFFQRVRRNITAERVVKTLVGGIAIGVAGYVVYSFVDNARTSIATNKIVREVLNNIDIEELSKNLAKHPEVWVASTPVSILVDNVPTFGPSTGGWSVKEAA